MTTENWQPTSRYVAKEPSVWERIAATYGKPFAELKAPEGYRFRMVDGEPEFRGASKSDTFLTREYAKHTAASDWPTNWPRLILEPIPEPPKETRWTFDETGEVRCALANEWALYMPTNGRPQIFQAGAQGSKATVRILRVVSREAK